VTGAVLAAPSAAFIYVPSPVGPTGSCTNESIATPYPFGTPVATVDAFGVVNANRVDPTDSSSIIEVEISGGGVNPEIFSVNPRKLTYLSGHTYWSPNPFKFRPSVPGLMQRVRLRVRGTLPVFGDPQDQCTKWSSYSNPVDVVPGPASDTVPLCNQQSRRVSGAISYWIPSTSVDEEIDRTVSPVRSSTLKRDAADLSAFSYSCPEGGLYNPQSTSRSFVELADDPYTAGSQICSGTVSGVGASRQVTLSFGQVGPCYLHSLPAAVYDNVSFTGHAQTITITAATRERASAAQNWGSNLRVIVGETEISSGSITRNSSTSVSFSVGAGAFSGPQTVFVTDRTAPAYVTKIEIKPIVTTIYADCAIGEVLSPNVVTFRWYPVTESTYRENECLTSIDGTPITPRPGTDVNGFSFTRGPVYGGVSPYYQGYGGSILGHEIQSWQSAFYLDRTTSSTTTVNTSGTGPLTYFLEVNNFVFGGTPATTSQWNYETVRGIVQISPRTQELLQLSYMGYLDEQVTDSSLAGDSTQLLPFGGANDGRGNPWNAKIYSETTELRVSGGSGSGLISGSASPGTGAVSGDSCSMTADLFLTVSQTTPDHWFNCTVTVTKAASGLYRSASLVRTAEVRVISGAAPLVRSIRPVTVSSAGLRQMVQSGTATSQTALDLRFEDVPTGQGGFTGITHEVQLKSGSSWVQFSSFGGTGRFSYCSTSTGSGAAWPCEKYGTFGQRRSVPGSTPFVEGTTYTFRVKTTATSQSAVYSDEFSLTVSYAPEAPTVVAVGGTTALRLAWSLPESSLPAGDDFGLSYHLDNNVGSYELQVSRTSDFADTETIVGREWSTSYTWSSATLDIDRPYYFRLRAIGNQASGGTYGSIARGSWSNVVSYRFSSPLITVAKQVGNRIQVKWSTNQPGVSFPVSVYNPTTSRNEDVDHVDGIAGFQFQVVSSSSNNFSGAWTGSINETTVNKYSWSGCSGTTPPDNNPGTLANESLAGKMPQAGEECSTSLLTVCHGTTWPGCQISGLNIGETYFVRVRSFNYLGSASAARYSPWSNVANVTFGRLPGAPSIQADPGPCRVTLRWTAPADTGGLPIDKFEVEYVKILSDSPPTFDESTRTVVSFPVLSASEGSFSATNIETSSVISGLTGGTRYYFRSFVVNSIGRSSSGANSAVAETADGCSPTGAPTDAKPGEVVSYLSQSKEATFLDSGSIGGQLEIDGNVGSVASDLTSGELSIADTSNDITMDLIGQRGEVDAVADTTLQTLRFYTDGNGVASGTGFKPGTIAEVWLYSDQIFLGNTVVNADGTWEKVFKVPSDIQLGLHTIQAEGVTSENEERSLLAAVKVDSAPPSSSSGGTSSGTPGSSATSASSTTTSTTATTTTTVANKASAASGRSTRANSKAKVSDKQIPATGFDLRLWPIVALCAAGSLALALRRRQSSNW